MGTGDSGDRSWAAACHLAALAGWVLPLGHLLGPLVVWLLKRHEDAFIDEQGKEAVNFQLSATLYGVLLVVLPILLLFPVAVVTGPVPGAGGRAPTVLIFLVLVLLVLALAVAWHLLIIIAAARASNGEHYRYPLNLRLIR